MEGFKSDVVGVRFNGKNYALWEFQFRLHVQGRRMFSFLDGTTPPPTADATAKKREDWAANNATVMSLLLGSMEPDIALSLRSLPTAAAIWKHMADLYSKASASRKYDIEFDLAALKQEELDIGSYYQEAMTLWTEHDLITSSLVSAAATSDVLQERACSRVMHFLMNLRAEFEGICASLLHCNISTIEGVLPELLREETRLKSQAKLDIHASDPGAAFAVRQGRPQFARTTSGVIIFHFCKEPGHIQFHYKKQNNCNYCKLDGHLIADCPTLAQRGQNRNAAGNSHYRGGPRSRPAGGAYATAVTEAPSPGMSPEDVCKLVQEALKEAFASVPNLVSVGQLAEDRCRVMFDEAGCVVRDKKMGVEIGRGSKQGRVYMLDSISKIGGEADGSSGLGRATEVSVKTFVDQTGISCNNVISCSVFSAEYQTGICGILD
ncbi:unnamed protein product [Linum tenue]|uniref:Retrotransposon Copia-like N-terminal domain-containing protein n=1 Tax=Linum tenue TaxID=586396 RepID=A0AAV0KSS8_9ROSI|nr:unnamed protein product [Linum tenue]